MKFFTLISYQMKNVMDGNSMEVTISKMDIVICKKVINSMEIYNLITKSVSFQINANMPIFMQSLFLRIFAIFEFKYFKRSPKFFYINVKLNTLRY